jgi:hypothetical protein
VSKHFRRSSFLVPFEFPITTPSTYFYRYSHYPKFSILKHPEILIHLGIDENIFLEGLIYGICASNLPHQPSQSQEAELLQVPELCEL